MVQILVFLSAIAAGIIQSVTGFGSGVIMMMFFPAVFPVLNATALSSSICLVASTKIAWRYRKHVQLKYILLPSIFYIITSTLAVSFAKYVPGDLLAKVFGGFLVLLSIYFLFAEQNKKRKPTIMLAVVCAILSGIAGGLFGISGPPMVIYFISVLEDKEEYLGTLQLFFTINAIYLLIFRIYAGVYTPNLVVFSLIGLVGAILGERFGFKIMGRIDKERMKKIIYIFLGISGIINIFS